MSKKHEKEMLQKEMPTLPTSLIEVHTAQTDEMPAFDQLVKDQSYTTEALGR